MKRLLNCPYDRSTTDCSLASQTTRYEWMLLYEEATFCAIRCSSREGATWMQDKAGKLLSLPCPYHARIVTMRRWGDGLGYEANNDVTWLLLIDVRKERVCIQGLPGEPPPITLSILFPVAPPSRWPYCCVPKIIPHSQDGNDGA